MDDEIVDDEEETEIILDSEVILTILKNIFDLPERGESKVDHDKYLLEMLKLGGLTERQAMSLILYTDGMSVSDISMEISNSRYTQNISAALSQAVGKILKAITIFEVIRYDKNFIAKVFERGAAIQSTYKARLRPENSR